MSTKDKRVVLGPCSAKQKMVLEESTADILIQGGSAGSGKSYLALLKALAACLNDPAARVGIVRLSFPLLKGVGGLVDESKYLYKQFGAEWRVQPLEWIFPNGAMIKFMAMPADLLDLQGLQFTSVICDEGAEFTQEGILALKARLRGARYKGKISMMITCNPSRNSYLYEWIKFSLDDYGIPRPGTEDKLRWFVMLNSQMHWADSKEELFEKYGKPLGMEIGADFHPTSVRYIPMTIYDNPVLMKNNPGYLANLLSMSRVNQLRYLHGSWTAVADNGSVFNRDWLEVVEFAPPDVKSRVRSWDLAYSVASETYPNPDWTAGVKMSRSKEGVYYIEDVIRFRKLTDGVLKAIVDTAGLDGKNKLVTYPRDSGGGKANSVHMARIFAENGLYTKGIPISAHSSKMQRFLPFCSLCEAGQVRLVRGPWNEEFLSELERFIGDKKLKDDQVDACSDAFNTLSKQTLMPTFSIPDMVQASPVPSI